MSDRRRLKGRGQVGQAGSEYGSAGRGKLRPETRGMEEQLQGLQLDLNRNQLKQPQSGLPTAPVPPHPYVRSNWTTGLRSDQERVVHSTSTVVVLKDKFPKAMHHYLVLPKEKIDNLLNLTKGHLDLLMEMEEVAREMVARHPDSQFKIGFHAVQSMLQLHLHVISQDFQSVYMRKPRHWNSFNTAYFLSIDKVRESLVVDGKVVIEKIIGVEKEKLLSSGLMCNLCEYESKNMQGLKEHITSHWK